MKTMAVLAIIAVTAAACAADPKPKPKAPPVEACGIGAWDTKAMWQGEGAASGHVSWVVLLRNASKVTCSVAGAAEVFATNPATQEHGRLNVKRNAVLDEELQLATVKPGARAVLTLTSRTGCNGGLSIISYTEVEIAMGGHKWPLEGLEVMADETDCLLTVGEWFTPAEGKYPA